MGLGSIGIGSIGNGSIGNGSIGNGSIGNGSIGNGLRVPEFSSGVVESWVELVGVPGAGELEGI